MRESRNSSSFVCLAGNNPDQPQEQFPSANTKHSVKIRRRAWQWLRLAAVVLACLPGAAMFAPRGLASAVTRTLDLHTPRLSARVRHLSSALGWATPVSGTISGTVYLDYNANGALDTSGASPNYAIDTGVPNVVVTAYEASGVTVGTATTNASGAYSLSAAWTGPYRIEFTSLPAGYFPSAVGTNNATTVRFVPDGNSSNIDLGLSRPADYSQNLPDLATGCYVYADQVTGPYNANAALLSFPYEAGSVYTSTTASDYDPPTTHSMMLVANQVGTTWGLAYARSTRRVYAAAYYKRHTGFGKGADGTINTADDAGAIYVINPVTNTVVNTFTVPNATTNPHNTSNYQTDNGNTGWDAVGKYSLGGMDLSDDDANLYVMNLENRTLYRLNPTTGAVLANQQVPLSPPNSPTGDSPDVDIRPFAVEYYHGQLYVGLICSAQSTGNASDMWAYVYTANPTTLAFSASPVFQLALNYPRGKANCCAGQDAEWRAWQTSFGGSGSGGSGQYIVNPQAMLTSVVFENDNLALGFRDRVGDQIGNGTQSNPANSTLYEPRTAGEVLRACGNPTSGWTIESNGRCGGSGNAPQNTGQGPGNGEFYCQDDYSTPPNTANYHDEVLLGGLVNVPGVRQVLSTAFDPIPAFDLNNTFDNGIRWLNGSNGSTDRAYRVFDGNSSDLATLGKASGLSDLVALSDAAPLQLGNRVWNDANGNGVQDPGEGGITGVTVELWAGLTQVGQATTDSSGNYYFGGASNTNMLGSASICSGTVSVRVNANSDDAEQRLNDNSVSIGSTDLELLYDDGIPTSQLVGTRFNGLAIPRNAVITGAYIEFTPRSDGQTVTSGNPTITIRGEAAGNPSTFLASSNDLSNRATTSASASWSPAAWSVGTVYQTASLTGVAQELVNRSDWSSGNSMAFIFSGDLSTAFRRAWAYDGDNPSAPRLVVTYNCPYSVNPSTAYQIRIPNAATQTGKNLTTADADPGTNGDARDSDAALSGATAVISLTTGGYGENNHTYDFGFTSATVTYSVGNRVWYDTNNNGVMDGAEVGVNNVTVDLLNNSNTQIATTLTDSSGYYRFDGIAAGTGYRVRIRGSNFNGGGALNGYQNSASNTSGTDQRDNGVDPAGNNPSTAGVLSSSFNLGAALQPTAEPDFTASGNGAHGPNGDVTDNLTVDFGFYCIAIGNLVFEDQNASGTFDGADVGVAGAGLALFQSDGTTIVRVGLDGILGTPDDVSGNDGTVNTNYIQSTAGGGYQFKGLPPGSYIVRIYPPYGYKSTNDIASSANPNNGTDNDDNGIGNVAGAVASAALTLTAGSGTGVIVTNSTGLTNNPTLDFGLVTYSPTAVRLTELTAQFSGGAANSPAGNNRAAGVTLNWRTGFEADSLGFNLYRNEGGQRVKINPSLIAGSALLAGARTLLTAGNGYTWTDAKGQPGMNYWLEELDLSGKNTWYGPVLAAGNPAAGGASTTETNLRERSPLLADLNAALPSSGVSLREWAGEEETGRTGNGASGREPALRVLSAASNLGSSAWNLPSQSAAKFAVRKSGWYRVTQAELAAVGFNTNVNPVFLQLFADGVEVPIKVSGKSSFGFESLEFYGRGLDVPSTDTRIYWLVAGNPSARRWESTPGKQPERVTVNSFRSTVERKERLLYVSALLNGEAENWFGALIRSGEATLQKLTTRYVERKTREAATVEIALQGVNDQAHTVNIELNGHYAGALSFLNQEHAVKQFSLPSEWLLDGENEFKLTAAGGGSDYSLVDWIRLSYARSYRAENDALNFSLAAGQTAFISGFSTSNIRVLQLSDGYSTDRNALRELTVKPQLVNDNLGRSYGFSLQGDGGAYLALADQRLERVAAVTLNQPSDWRAEKNAADFLILTHSAFKAAAGKLAQVRRGQGWQVVVVDVEDAYDEFSYGAHTPQAIKDLLTHARRYWQRKPSHALLVGAGTYDPRDYQGTGLIDFIPVKLGEMSKLETAFENWFADIDDDGLPNLALGRLPARNVSQAETIIAKLINFKPGEPLRSALLVSDRTTDGYDFRAASDQLAKDLPVLMFKQFINRNDGGAEQLRGQIIQSINQSPLLVNWHGHGSVDVWTGEGILRARDAAALTNRLPSLFVMTTCLNGYFIGIPQLSLSDALLLNTAGGAFAVVSSSALTSPVPQLTFNRQLYRSLFGAGQTLGDAFNAAKAATPDRDVRNSYVLLGDPTLQLTQVRSLPKR